MKWLSGGGWEPDALTAQVRFWEGSKFSIEHASRPMAPDGKPMGNGGKIVYAKLERLCSSHPELAIGRILRSKSLGGNQVILARSA